MAGGGELTHVQPDLREDHLGGFAPDAGDLIEASKGGKHRGVALWPAALSATGPRSRYRRQQRLDPDG